MARSRVIVSGLVLGALASGCGGKKPKTTTANPKTTTTKTNAPAAAETEADREARRHKAALAIIPEGSNCLPPALKEPGAPRLELAVVGTDPMICAIDTDKARLLGPVGCFKLNIGTSGLTYEAPRPLPGLGFSVLLDDHCARGFCLPADAKLPADKTARMSWNLDSTKVAVLAGDTVHIFDAASKAHASQFSIRGDKGLPADPWAINWVEDALFVEGGDANMSGVWVYKADGTAVGPIEVLGGKPGTVLSTRGGSFSILEKNRIGISEQGFSTMTTYDVDSGKRTKVVRKLAKAPCKPEEMDAYWKDPGSVADGKCKEHMTKTFGYFTGATAIAGSKNLLVVLRNARLGELGVVDPKTLVEQKKIIKLSWCGEAPAAPAP